MSEYTKLDAKAFQTITEMYFKIKKHPDSDEAELSTGLYDMALEAREQIDAYTPLMLYSIMAATGVMLVAKELENESCD